MHSFLRGRPVRSLVALALACAFLVVAGGPAAPAHAEGVVNLNQAEIEELVRLPAVGESRARAIVALREERGGFEAVDELKDVKGIGEVSFERLRPLVTLTGPTTLQDE